MPSSLTYPGVYVEEVPSSVRAITGVATSVTAFIGYARRGPVNEPVLVQSYADFARVFGGLWSRSTMSQAVQQYFLNGGRDALVVRTARLTGAGLLAKKGQQSVGGTGNKRLTLESANPGEWADNLRVRIDLDTKDKNEAAPTLFNLSIRDVGTGATEVLRNLPLGSALSALVAQRSALVRVVTPPTQRPDPHDDLQPGQDPFDPAAPPGLFTAFPSAGAGSGEDGEQGDTDLVPAADDGTGVYALARADIFNLLCIPPYLPPDDPGAGRVLDSGAKGRAARFCVEQRALFIVDPHPDWAAPAQVTSGGNDLDTYVANIATPDRRNAALYMPYMRVGDPLQAGALVEAPPSGAIAGVMARTDAARGVWKAPAGLDAGLAGVQELKAKLTDAQNGILNPLGVNCLRTFPGAGSVVWGSRTLAGADSLASEWKYVPVRRTALFIEESLYRGTQWVVFEPNDAPLWSQIRLNVGAFMNNLFRQGAFAGVTPREAYFVKCDGETTTQDDVNLGIVNIDVGFAPLKPAEFVVIRIEQMAGQTGSA
jgi:Bacteriophage tail sheath protein